MRLIDADELMKGFEENGTWWEQARLEEALTIDAVPVVRCKDCMFHKTNHCAMYDGYCFISNDDDFCSYGVRKDDNND